METKICLKCNKRTLNYSKENDKWICDNCFAYYERNKETGKWRFIGKLSKRQQTTPEEWHGPQEIQETTQQQSDENIELKCPKCLYVWKSNSKLPYVTCPSCMRKSERIKFI